MRLNRLLPALILAALSVGGCGTATSPSASSTTEVSAPVPTTPTPSPSPTPGPADCLVGTWRSTAETEAFEFYQGVDPLPFKAKGTTRTLRADGTGTWRAGRVTYQGTYQGTSLAIILNGEYEFTWSATDSTLTYGDITKTSMTITYMSGGKKLQTVSDRTGSRALKMSYTCSDKTSTDTNNDNHTAAWTRVS